MHGAESPIRPTDFDSGLDNLSGEPLEIPLVMVVVGENPYSDESNVDRLWKCSSRTTSVVVSAPIALVFDGRVRVAPALSAR
jgi:hypothetical protein